MSIADKISRLQTAKSNIATAITNKGGTIQTGDGFESFPARINAIPTSSLSVTYNSLNLTGNFTNTQWTGESVDTTGITANAQFTATGTITDPTSITVTGTGSMTVTPTHSPTTWGTTEGSQTVTFSYVYNGTTRTATKTANVLKKAIGLVITGDWTNTQYVNTAVDYTGLIFTASYSDGTTATVTPTSLSPSTWGATVGSQTCVFTYTENGVSVTASKSANVQEAVSDNYLTFTPSTGTVSVTPGYLPSGVTTDWDYSWNATTKEYSTDGGNTWNTYTMGTTVTGNTVKFRGLGGTNAGGCVYSSSGSYVYNCWNVVGTSVACSGNVETLLDYQMVANGQHPTMGVDCYSYMFRGCTSLTTAPELPATTLADWCYDYMFSGCTSLTTAPELPATTLASSCYYCIFYGCTSLTTASELPVTTLAESCYQNMFNGCTSLTTAPELPATTLAHSCYYGMFSNCTSLYVSDTSGEGHNNVLRLPAEGVFANTYMQMLFNGCPGTRSTIYTPCEQGKSYTYYTQNTPV